MRCLVMFAATLVAIDVAYVMYLFAPQPVVHDAALYHRLGAFVLDAGLLGWEHARDVESPRIFLALRTYGYPGFLAGLMTVTGPSPERLLLAAFNVQLAVHIAACWYGAERVGRALNDRRVGAIVYAATVANPVLLVATTALLTDSLSCSLAYVAAAAMIGRGAGALTLGMGAAAAATMIRPSNAVVLGVVAMIWAIHVALLRRDRVIATAAPVVAAGLIFLPQVVNNHALFGSWSPLPVTGLYGHTLALGTQLLKYQTVTVPELPGRLFHTNPFVPEGVTTAEAFVRADPLGFVATTAVHLFALFDQSYPLPYITDVRPWYRWPLFALNWAFLTLAVVGIGRAGACRRAAGSSDRSWPRPRR